MGDRILYPRSLFVRCRAAYPASSEHMDEAEMTLSGLEASAEGWRVGIIDPLLPITSRPTLLSDRCAILCTLIAYRTVELGEGLAREVEANALFPAGAVARSLLEMMGLSALARQRFQTFEAVGDHSGLDDESIRLLLASRYFGDARAPRHFTTGELIDAGANQLGPELRSEYGFLSDLAHPNSLLMWAANHEDRMLGFDRPGIAPTMAGTLLNICGPGASVVARNCLTLVEWSQEHDVAFLDGVGK